MMKRLLVRFGLWVASLGGWTPCRRPHLPADDQVEMARAIVRDIQQRFPDTPGPVKAREALRVLLNLRQGASSRDLNLLIELALQEPA
jgi:hypothetical protein